MPTLQPRVYTEEIFGQIGDQSGGLLIAFLLVPVLFLRLFFQERFLRNFDNCPKGAVKAFGWRLIDCFMQRQWFHSFGARLLKILSTRPYSSPSVPSNKSSDECIMSCPFPSLLSHSEPLDIATCVAHISSKLT